MGIIGNEVLITKERILIDKGREILEQTLPAIQLTPGYKGWRMVETEDYLPRKGEDLQILALFLIVKVDGEANAKDVMEHIENVEQWAYSEFAKLVLESSLEGKVNIFILFDTEE